MDEIYKELNKFYDAKTSFRKGKELRVLQLFVTAYYIFDITKYDFTYDYINDRQEEAVLKKIYDFKPDIILTQDSIETARKYYDHSHILYINENDYSAYMYLMKYITFQKNEIHFYAAREKKHLLTECSGYDSFYNHIVYRDLTPSITLSETIHEMSDSYDADVTIISGSNSSVESAKKYVEYLCLHWMEVDKENTIKTKLMKIFDEMFDFFMEKMDNTGYFIENEDEYFAIFLELANKYKMDLTLFNDADLKYLKVLLKLVVGYTVYRRLIVKWVIEQGYSVALWGDTWKNCKDLQEYYHGNIVEREKLAQIYNRSRICLFTNPDIGIHMSVFEMISSKTLCIAYQNDNETIASLNRYFKDGESIVLFKNKQELLKKIDKYLYDDEKRRMIIENGNQIIKNRNLYREYELSRVIREAVKLAKKNMHFT